MRLNNTIIDLSKPRVMTIINVTDDSFFEHSRTDDEQSIAERVKKAYDIATEAHAGQKRLSGEPYIIHPIAVARILADMLADKVGVAAVFSGNDEIGYKYAVASRTYDVRKIAKELNSFCAGRGGGTAQMVQGSLATYRDMIESCWREIELNDD